jgi:hypothetical protein
MAGDSILRGQLLHLVSYLDITSVVVSYRRDILNWLVYMSVERVGDSGEKAVKLVKAVKMVKVG